MKWLTVLVRPQGSGWNVQWGVERIGGQNVYSIRLQKVRVVGQGLGPE